MKKLSHIAVVLLAAVLWAFSSCTRDTEVLTTGTDSDVEGTAKELRLNVIVPGHSQDPQSRAISATEENTIQTVVVLAFKVDGTNETFDYSVSGTLAPGNTAGSTTQTFVANLQAHSYQQRFVVITNAESLVGATVAGTSQGTPKATMLANIKYTYASNQDRWTANASNNYTQIPMWGESAPETITASTKTLASTLYLMRMVARIDVKLDTSVTGLTGKFKLRSVSLYNTVRGGNIVPDASKVVSEQRNGSPYLRVNAVTVPTEDTRQLGPILYTDFSAPGVNDVAMIGAIYTFEIANSTTDAQATCLVVGGVYGTDANPTYYRIDLLAAGTQNRLDILRNHQYVVNINSVVGSGYASADEAFNHKGQNMTAVTLVQTQQGLDNIAFNKQYSLSSNKFALSLFANQYTGASPTGDNTFQATTDFPAGWTLDRIVGSDGTTASGSWLTISSASGAANTVTNLIASATQNTTGASRTATIYLKADNLSLPITVTQSTNPAIALMIYNQATNAETQELVFSAAAGVTPAAQSFRVDWLPASNPVNVAAAQVAQYEFPNPGGNTAVQDGAPYHGQVLNPGNGTFTYTVQPPALTAAELAANPFIAKATRFDYTVNNGATTMLKSITLRQLYYTLRVEDPSRSFFYPMGNQTVNSGTNPGAVYNYNVRSNTNWRIANIVESPRVTGTALIATHTGADNVYTGAIGTANSTPGGGYREQLTTNPNARGNSGYADVTYAPVTDGQFALVTQRLFFPAAPFRIWSVCRTTNGGDAPRVQGYWSANATGGAPYTDHDVQTMTQAVANFGTNINPSPATSTSTPSSTVFVPQISVSGTWNGGNGNVITTGDVNGGAGYDMLVISGNTTIPYNGNTTSAEAQAIWDNFLSKDRPVLLCTDDTNSPLALAVALMNNGRFSGNMTCTSGLNGNAAVYRYKDLADPILDGPFKNGTTGTTNSNPGSLRGVCWGVDGSGSLGAFVSDISQIVAYSDLNDQSNTTTANDPNNYYSSFRFARAPLIVVGDGGFLISADQSSTTGSPTVVNTSTKAPDRKSYGGNSSNQRWIHNSYFVANTVAWAVQRRTNQ
jgi:hypothetical protein